MGTLYRYELKKLLCRKLVWITFCAFLILLTAQEILSESGTYYVNGEAVDTYAHRAAVDREYKRALSGRLIDQGLLNEMAEGYGKLTNTTGAYGITEEYEKYARPYECIFNFAADWMGMTTKETLEWEPDEQMLYAVRGEMMRASWESVFLSDGEKEFWEKKNASLALPLTWEYSDGYIVYLFHFGELGVWVLLFACVSLSGVFAGEHTKRTDQLLLTSAKGKDAVYWAKVLAGASVAMVYSLVALTIEVLFTFGRNGFDGFGAEIQFAIPTYPYPLTLGQACLIVGGILCLTAVLVGVIVMILSERLGNSIAALAIVFGFVVAALVVRIPNQYRVAGQIWNWLPTAFLSLWNVFDVRTVGLFGHYAVSWQAVPVIYVLCGAGIVCGGKRVYRNYQVSGR